jgi:putative transposase
MKQKKAYKYRMYPTEEQANILARTFGCCRFVYNWALRQRTDAFFQRGERLYYNQLAVMLTELKKQEEVAWLSEVSSVPLQQSLRHLDTAFRNFFEGRAEYPTFHKKHAVQAATYAANAFTWDGKQLTLAKMDTPLDIHWSRSLPKGCKPTTVTLSKDCANRYFVSILVEEDIKHLPVVKKQVGLDLGLKSMLITSDGHTYGNPKFFAKDEKKLAKAQRRHARAKKGGKNRRKAQQKVARIHARIADRRKDYQHKLSTQIIRENQVVCVESLSVKNMLQNHSLAEEGYGSLYIYVCVKQTPDSASVYIDPISGRVDEERFVQVLNPADACAVEAAVRIKEHLGGTIVALTLGPEDAEGALRAAPAIGVDSAVRLWNPQAASWGPFAVASVLSVFAG